jgi:hypothetical protein
VAGHHVLAVRNGLRRVRAKGANLPGIKRFFDAMDAVFSVEEGAGVEGHVE